MHVAIFTSLRHYVRTAFPSVPRDVLGCGGDHGSPGERFRRQLKGVSRAVNVTEQELLHGFGAFASSTTFKHMFRDYYTECSGTAEFLLNVEHRIHETVRRTIPGAAPPQLQVTRDGSDGVSIKYTSPRRLCELVPGLVQGVAAHYGEPVKVTESQCMKRGGSACVFAVGVG